jgi:hypothetical protein
MYMVDVHGMVQVDGTWLMMIDVHGMVHLMYMVDVTRLMMYMMYMYTGDVMVDVHDMVHVLVHG